MRALRFLWRGVLAFDRVGSRIPQLVQIWLVELFLVMCTAFFVAKVVDIHGAAGVPGTGGSVPGVFWGALVVALVCWFVFLKRLLRPRIVRGTWAPLVRVEVGGGELVAPNTRWAVSYDYLTSHPSYALLQLLTLPIPAVMWAATRHHGDDAFYWRVAGLAGMAVIVLLALLRLVAWYVVRSGRTDLAEAAEARGHTVARIAWEVAWKPVLMLVVLMYLIPGVPLGVMAWQEHRTIQALPVAAPGEADTAGHYYRVVGEVVDDPVYWAPNGTGRGGNNYAGAGVLVHLDEGGEVLLLAESMSVPDFVGSLEDADAGRIHTQGRVIDEVTDDQVTYYGFDLSDFPPPDPEGRVLVLHSYP
jgi:hypothetical protein